MCDMRDKYCWYIERMEELLKEGLIDEDEILDFDDFEREWLDREGDYDSISVNPGRTPGQSQG